MAADVPQLASSVSAPGMTQLTERQVARMPAAQVAVSAVQLADPDHMQRVRQGAVRVQQGGLARAH